MLPNTRKQDAEHAPEHQRHQQYGQNIFKALRLLRCIGQIRPADGLQIQFLLLRRKARLLQRGHRRFQQFLREKLVDAQALVLGVFAGQRLFGTGDLGVFRPYLALQRLDGAFQHRYLRVTGGVREDGIELGFLGDEVILEFGNHAQLQSRLGGRVENAVPVAVVGERYGGIPQLSLGGGDVFLRVVNPFNSCPFVEPIDDILTFLQQEGVDLTRIFCAVSAHFELGDTVGAVQVVGDHGLVIAQELDIAAMGEEDAAEAVEDVDVVVAVDFFEIIGAVEGHHGIPGSHIGMDGFRRAGGVAATQPAQQAGEAGTADPLTGAVDHEGGFADVHRRGDETEVQDG